MRKLDLVCFDMAGTTILDNHEVEMCFKKSLNNGSLFATDERILSLQGYSKLDVFKILWKEQDSMISEIDLIKKSNESYNYFKEVLEDYYLENEVFPTEGTIDVFEYLRNNNIKIALTTGFYRKVAGIILNKIGWLNKYIDISVTPDDTQKGRPDPSMIFFAMNKLNITNLDKVINIGDTPVDLQFGKNAGVKYNLAVSNGTHSKGQLLGIQNDGILNSISDLIPFIEKNCR